MGTNGLRLLLTFCPSYFDSHPHLNMDRTMESWCIPTRPICNRCIKGSGRWSWKYISNLNDFWRVRTIDGIEAYPPSNQDPLYSHDMNGWFVLIRIVTSFIGVYKRINTRDATVNPRDGLPKPIHILDIPPPSTRLEYFKCFYYYNIQIVVDAFGARKLMIPCVQDHPSAAVTFTHPDVRQTIRSYEF